MIAFIHVLMMMYTMSMFSTMPPARPSHVHRHADWPEAATIVKKMPEQRRLIKMAAMEKVGVRHSDERAAAGHEAWHGHWLLERSEDDKAEAALKAEGLPFVARKIAMKFKPERRFSMDENGGLVGEVKAISGGWTQLRPERETVTRQHGYTAHAVTSWESDDRSVMVSVTRVTGPLGGHAGTTTTRHYLDSSQRLVSETTCAPQQRLQL